MVIETFVQGARPVYERAAEKGRMLPTGVLYLDSWIDESLQRCFQLMETDDPSALDDWKGEWSVSSRSRSSLSSAQARRLRVL